MLNSKDICNTTIMSEEYLCEQIKIIREIRGHLGVDHNQGNALSPKQCSVNYQVDINGPKLTFQKWKRKS